jgi:hypothetical protein
VPGARGKESSPTTERIRSFRLPGGVEEIRDALEDVRVSPADIAQESSASGSVDMHAVLALVTGKRAVIAAVVEALAEQALGEASGMGKN